MKVLFITTWYPTKFNPVGGIFVREHAKAVNLFNEVVVLHSSTEILNLKGLYKIELEDNKDITEGIPTFRVWRKRIPIKAISYIIFTLSILKGFKHIVSLGFKPDIIHAHIFEAGIPAVLIGKIYKLPVLITEHSSNFMRNMLSSIEFFEAKIAFRNAKYVLPVSYALQRAIENYTIRANFKIIPNVVDTSIFYPSLKIKKINNPKRILFVGLLVAIKGIPYLLQAINKLRKQRDDWHLDIVGDGPSRVEYENLANQLGISQKVTFHGIKLKKEVAEFMRNADLLVLPSIKETFSTVTVEALASGIPVLATRCGGPEEFINENVGLLVDPSNKDSLCDGLNYMLDHLDNFIPAKLSNYANILFGLYNVGAQLHNIYLKILHSDLKKYNDGYSGEKVLISK